MDQPTADRRVLLTQFGSHLSFWKWFDDANRHPSFFSRKRL